ncbi:hypothetical protein ACF0H5_009488 [Mactra antiquata]
MSSNESVTFQQNYNISVDGLIDNRTNQSDQSFRLDQLNERYASTLLPFTIILGFFGLIGIVGNILVFIVYGCGKQFKDKKFRVYVLTLAFIDLITCLTLIPAEMIKHLSYFNFTERALCKTKCFFNVFAASSASFCLILIAIDRYIMTCHPLFFAKLQKYSSNLAARICIFALFLAVLTSVPSAVLCGITKSKMVDFNGVDVDIYLCITEPYYTSTTIRYAYRVALCAAQTGISITIIILYARIGHAVKTVMKIKMTKEAELVQLQELRHQCAKGLHLGHCQCKPCQPAIPSKIKLLFIVTLVFIVTYVFYMSLSWIDQTKLSTTEFFFFSIFFRLYFIHSIINPFLYIKMDRYFRNRCNEIMAQVSRCKRDDDW